MKTRAVNALAGIAVSVATVALVPAVGFGEKPTLIALFLYGLLPIFENSMTGLSTLPPAIVEAATVTDSNGDVVEIARIQPDGSLADPAAAEADAAEPTE